MDQESLSATRTRCAGTFELHVSVIRGISVKLSAKLSTQKSFVRQSSLPSAGSDLSLPEGELEWPETIEIEGERVELRKKNRDISCTSSYDSMEGKYVFLSYRNMECTLIKCVECSTSSSLRSAPLLDSFGKEQASSTSSPYIASQKTQEPSIDFELDVKVLINSGKCVLHTKDPGREDEIKL